MPTGFVKKTAQKKHISVKKAESNWSKAKKAAASYKNKGATYWKVVSSIFKKMK